MVHMRFQLFRRAVETVRGAEARGQDDLAAGADGVNAVFRPHDLHVGADELTEVIKGAVSGLLVAARNVLLLPSVLGCPLLSTLLNLPIIGVYGTKK